MTALDHALAFSERNRAALRAGGLPARAVNRLIASARYQRPRTVGDVAAMTDDELYRIPTWGPVTIGEIRRVVPYDPASVTYHRYTAVLRVVVQVLARDDEEAEKHALDCSGLVIGLLAGEVEILELHHTQGATP